jgi:Na+-translocating ferredoxin:NAD+ oxidoreductase RnfA subunit
MASMLGSCDWMGVNVNESTCFGLRLTLVFETTLHFISSLCGTAMNHLSPDLAP